MAESTPEIQAVSKNLGTKVGVLDFFHLSVTNNDRAAYQ